MYVVFKLSYAIIIIKHSNKINYYRMDKKLLVNAITIAGCEYSGSACQCSMSCFATEMTSLVNHITKRRFIVLLVHVSNSKIGYVRVCLLIITRRDSFRLRKHSWSNRYNLFATHSPRQVTNYNVSLRLSGNDSRHTFPPDRSWKIIFVEIDKIFKEKSISYISIIFN